VGIVAALVVAACSSSDGSQDGGVYAWGPRFGPELHFPTIADWKTFDTAGQQYCGIRADGSLNCGFGEDEVPTRVGTATDWTKVTVGTTNACGLRGTALYCWGDNTYGIIADGTAYSATPLVVPQ
jgi:hypothetical protein